MIRNKEVILETIVLEKHFGGIKAVDKVDLKLYRNEILGIVGDNGAGKSSLIKTITGVYRKDGGEIFVSGKKVEIHNTRDAKELGIETVYQDKGLIQILDATSNLFLGREKLRNNISGKWFKFLDVRYMRKETEKLLSKVGVQLRELIAPVNSLSGGQQQSIAVGRAIYWTGKILIFDEPTNNLGVKEQSKAINLIKTIRETYKEISIIVITHNLYHIFELVDRIMVLRNGRVVGIREKEKTTHNEIVSMITGVTT
ncbi:MAG: sugar ABC transporter ATP-binding protein [Parcubacteria group bacterium]|nr:sugar ABC transporter ATP-binding protein [Parcubacteria group bacterium]